MQHRKPTLTKWIYKSNKNALEILLIDYISDFFKLTRGAAILFELIILVSSSSGPAMRNKGEGSVKCFVHKTPH
jgi:hypothetical protein